MVWIGDAQIVTARSPYRQAIGAGHTALAHYCAMRAANQPEVPWWARTPELIAGIGVVALVISALMPWFTGPYDHGRPGPWVSIWLVVASAVLALVLMYRRSRWSWAPGVFVLAATLMILIGLHAQVVCPTDVEIEGNIAQACFTEEWTSGSTFFAVGGSASSLASFIAPWLMGYAEDRSWEGRGP